MEVSNYFDINLKMIKQARPILKKVFKENSNWKKLIYRLPKSGLILMKTKELDSYLKNL